MVPAVDVFINYGGVYVFHVCFDVCVVYGVGIRVDVFDVPRVVECFCLLSLGVARCVVM